jgi:hypothetical protein
MSKKRKLSDETHEVEPNRAKKAKPNKESDKEELLPSDFVDSDVKYKYDITMKLFNLFKYATNFDDYTNPYNDEKGISRQWDTNRLLKFLTDKDTRDKYTTWDYATVISSFNGELLEVKVDRAPIENPEEDLKAYLNYLASSPSKKKENDEYLESLFESCLGLLIFTFQSIYEDFKIYLLNEILEIIINSTEDQSKKKEVLSIFLRVAGSTLYYDPERRDFSIIKDILSDTIKKFLIKQNLSDQDYVLLPELADIVNEYSNKTKKVKRFPGWLGLLRGEESDEEKNVDGGRGFRKKSIIRKSKKKKYVTRKIVKKGRNTRSKNTRSKTKNKTKRN